MATAGGAPFVARGKSPPRRDKGGFFPVLRSGRGGGLPHCGIGGESPPRCGM